jgi:hypothetical protein
VIRKKRRSFSTANDSVYEWAVVLDSDGIWAMQSAEYYAHLRRAGEYALKAREEADASTKRTAHKHGRKLMIRWIAFAAFALAVATSAQAMSPAPLNLPDGLTTQVAFGCGPGRTRIRGVCVSRAAIRQVRRCALWGVGHVCRRWF